MASKQKQEDGKPVSIPFATYANMCDVMDELACRGPQEEALMLRVAKAGDIDEVMDKIKCRRVNRAKFAKPARNLATVGDTPAKKAGRKLRKLGGGRRRADRKLPPAGAGDGAREQASA
jgi:hypothetical protein